MAEHLLLQWGRGSDAAEGGPQPESTLNVPIGFNEAAAVMPRKALRARPGGLGPPKCFNEAAAVMPRKARNKETDENG